MMEMYAHGVFCAYGISFFQKLHKKGVVTESVLCEKVLRGELAAV